MDGRETSYRLYSLLALFLGHERELFPCRVAQLHRMYVVWYASILGWTSNSGSMGRYHSRYVSSLCRNFHERTDMLLKGFAHMKNSFSEGSHLATNDFIGLLIWFAAFIPLVLVRPERLQIPFAISFVLFASSCIGILIW